MAAFTLNINGAQHEIDVAPSTPMLWVLRDHLKMGLILRELVHDSFSDMYKSIVGGAKVKFALYSGCRKNQVLFRIQQGKGKIVCHLCTMWIQSITIN